VLRPASPCKRLPWIRHDQCKRSSPAAPLAGFYLGRFAQGLSDGADAISEAGTAGSLADRFSIYSCPATNITVANAIANMALHLIKLTKTRQITPYLWAHPDEQR
jgi:hypothetical protein